MRPGRRPHRWPPGRPSDAGGYGARRVWLYATILTVGYMVYRGLAKTGSREPYNGHDGTR